VRLFETVRRRRHIPEAGRRLDSLDGLRALAVLFVFGFHVDMSRFRGGFLGVDIFFALSGYLITMLLLREFRANDRIWLKGFYMRRFLRLMPAVAVLIVVAVPVAKLEHIGSALHDGLATLLYLMDVFGVRSSDHGGALAHTWSLAVEEQFYLVWPALLVIGLRRRIRMELVIIGIAISGMATSLLLADRSGMSSAYRTPFPHIPVLGAGILLALALDNPDYRFVRRIIDGLRRSVAGWFAAFVLVAALFVVHGDRAWLYWGGFLLFGVAATVLIGHLVLTPGSRVARTFSNLPAVWLGRRSYAFYLWHYPVLAVLGLHLTSSWALGAIGLPITLLLAAASWRYVEQPFLRRKVKFEPGLEHDKRRERLVAAEP
jgi:peptidoglycan/LPS O-acetylase OafA/YrhL